MSQIAIDLKVGRSTLYRWLDEFEFKCELNRQMGEIADATDRLIVHEARKSVFALARERDAPDEDLSPIVISAANKIISHHAKIRMELYANRVKRERAAEDELSSEGNNEDSEW